MNRHAINSLPYRPCRRLICCRGEQSCNRGRECNCVCVCGGGARGGEPRRNDYFNILTIFSDSSKWCVLSPNEAPGSVLQTQSAGDWLMQNKEPIKHDKLSAPRSLLHCVQQSCELISSTRTRLQAPREHGAGIMLRCQHLRNIVPY